LKPPRAHLDVLGLNHLSWFRGLEYEGCEFWPEVLAVYLEHAPDKRWDPHTLRALGMIPNGYFEYYYYTRHKRALQESWPPSRAEEVMKIEEELLAQYADIKRDTPPEELFRNAHYII
jgi:6-phospho-beta-glucosidase